MKNIQLNLLKDFFDGQSPLFIKKWTASEVDKRKTRQFYIDLSEEIVSFFNDNNPAERDLRDASKTVKRIDELISNNDEDTSDCCWEKITDEWLCSNCLEHIL